VTCDSEGSPIKSKETQITKTSPQITPRSSQRLATAAAVAAEAMGLGLRRDCARQAYFFAALQIRGVANSARTQFPHDCVFCLHRCLFSKLFFMTVSSTGRSVNTRTGSAFRQVLVRVRAVAQTVDRRGSNNLFFAPKVPCCHLRCRKKKNSPRCGI